MDHLRDLDQIAYIRFASVYREFADLEDVQRELMALAERGSSPGAGQPTLLPETELQALTKGLRAFPARRRRGRPAGGEVALERRQRPCAGRASVKGEPSRARLLNSGGELVAEGMCWLDEPAGQATLEVERTPVPDPAAARTALAGAGLRPVAARLRQAHGRADYAAGREALGREPPQALPAPAGGPDGGTD